MRALFALVLLATVADAEKPRFKRFTQRTPQGRTQRGLINNSGALFEAFNGVGTTTVCSTTPPTGAKGEVLTFTRASAVVCTKTAAGGNSSTGIADGDLVSLTTNLPAVEYDNSGTLGLLHEPNAATQILTSQRAICSAPWANVGTPICTANGAGDAWGTTTAALIEDDSAVAIEGRTQTVSTTSATKFTAYCVVKGGTLTQAAVSITGTGSSTGDCVATVSGLSTTTSSIVGCTSSAAYAGTLTAIAYGVVPGDGTTVAQVGTVSVSGCNVVPSSPGYRTSFIDGASRAANSLPMWSGASTTWPAGSAGSASVTISTLYTPIVGETTLTLPPASGNPDMLGRWVGAASGCYMQSGADLASGGAWITGTNRWSCSTGRSSGLNGTVATAAGNSMASGGTTLGLGSSGGFGVGVTGIWSRICFDPSASRCGQ